MQDNWSSYIALCFYAYIWLQVWLTIPVNIAFSMSVSKWIYLYNYGLFT